MSSKKLPTMQLLSTADTRPNKEAQVWFIDGLRLVQAAPFLWAGVSLSSLGISLAAFILGSLFAAFSPLLALLPIVFTQLFIQAGMLYLCAPLAAKQKTDINHFFSVIMQLTSRGFLQLGLAIIALEILLHIVQQLLFPQPLFWLENEQIHMAEAHIIYQFAAFTISSQLLILVLTWAILPLLIEFPQQTFLALLRLQFDGMAKNLMPLLNFSLLCMSAMSGAFLLFMLIAKLSAALGFLLLITLILWGWPLLNAWTFSTVRHIFMNW